MPRVRGRVGRLLASAGAALLVAGSLIALTPVAAEAATPLPNPGIPAQCGLAVTLVLDASGSVQQSNAVGAVRSAASAFLEAFADTGSTARVIQFASLSQQLASRRWSRREPSIRWGIPQRDRRLLQPDPATPRHDPDQALQQRQSGRGRELVGVEQQHAVHELGPVARGRPRLTPATSSSTSPTATPQRTTSRSRATLSLPNDVGMNTNVNATIEAVTMDRAVTQANAAKLSGARVLALGVGEALQNAARASHRLTQLSGPDIARTIAEFDVETTDVSLIADFDDLAAAVRALVLDLCSPSLTIRKFAQSATDATYQPAPGWDMTVTPTVPGGFDWILPTGATGPSSTLATDANGYAQFQWEPTLPDTLLGRAGAGAAPSPGTSPADLVRTTTSGASSRTPTGATRVVTGELTTAGGAASFGLTGIGDEIGTCAVFNSFAYAARDRTDEGQLTRDRARRPHAAGGRALELCR